MRSRLLAAVMVSLIPIVFQATFLIQNSHAQKPAKNWYRGNLHTHTLWSDGDDFPEVITNRFAVRGYHFLALTDHNVLSVGKDRWVDVEKVNSRSAKALENYLNIFGAQWVETREVTIPEKRKPKSKKGASAETEANESQPKEPEVKTKQQVRLRSLKEFRGKFESPEKFLLIPAEEISDRADGKPIHMNAMNLRSVISPAGGKNAIEAINNNLRSAEEQAKRNGEPILIQLNHPNFGWAVTAEELAAVTNERFFEVYNGHPGINHLGDKTRPSIEKMWDIANTIRIDQLKSSPVFGLATDDSHNYHDHPGKKSKMGRGWVMVRTEKLATVNLIEAMKVGDFYCSSGIELESLSFLNNKLSLKIKTKDNVRYQTQFIGTRKDYDRTSEFQLDAEGKPIKATKLYSDDVGEVFATSDSADPSYQLSGNELYVRAVVTSSEAHPNPSFKGQKEQAWTQPVGW